MHPIKNDEFTKLRELKDFSKSQFVFGGERGNKLSPAAIAKVVARLGEIADFGFKVHPHQLRHACGYYLANKGATTRDIQAYLGHRNISNTEKYTALSSTRFDCFW